MRFNELEQLGVTVAAISDRTDGDCSGRATDMADGKSARAAVCRALGINAQDVVCARQVHGTHIEVVDAAHRGRGALGRMDAVPATDGFVTATPGIPLTIFVADCVPVFLFDPIAKAAGLIHAGRQGTLAGIAEKAVNTMRTQFSTHPSNIHAVLGPSAGPCCYEVSHEMARDFSSAGFPASGCRLDLWEANASSLIAAGVPRNNIIVCGICTICDGRFFSYRAHKTSERNMGLIML